LAAFLLVIGVATPTPSYAITGGQETGAAYSNVGFIWIDVGSLNGFSFCSGTLIAPTVVVTAAHCVGGEDPIVRVKVTFDSHVTFNGIQLANPGIEGTATFDSRYLLPSRNGGARGFIEQTDFDLGVVVLDAPASTVFPGITPAQLPAVGVLDSFARDARAKDSQAFTSVGYGMYRAPNTSPWDTTFTHDRRMATGPLDHLDPRTVWINGNANASWADGGFCFGDSGGPDFLGSTDTIVSVHSIVQTPCHNKEASVRLDTQSARDFLAAYVSLP